MSLVGDVMTVYREQDKQQSCRWLSTTAQKHNWQDFHTKYAQCINWTFNIFSQDAGQLMSFSVISLERILGCILTHKGQRIKKKIESVRICCAYMLAVSNMFIILQSAGSGSEGTPCWFTPAHQGLSPAILTPVTDQAARVLPNKMDVFNPASAAGSTWYCP